MESGQLTSFLDMNLSRRFCCHCCHAIFFWSERICKDNPPILYSESHWVYKVLHLIVCKKRLKRNNIKHQELLRNKGKIIINLEAQRKNMFFKLISCKTQENISGTCLLCSIKCKKKCFMNLHEAGQSAYKEKSEVQKRDRRAKREFQ